MNEPPSTTRATPIAAFVERRRRLCAALAGPAVIAAGRARSRNFRGNRYPFRAQSHFLYLVGAPLEDAVLLLGPAGATLYAHPPDPEEALWSGPEPTLAELEQRLGLEVRPLDELRAPGGSAVLPPQDADTAAELEEWLGREVIAGGGAELVGPDRALADAMIELRLRHDAAAIDQLREAARVTAAAHRAGMAATRPGRTEFAIRAAMEAVIVEQGMTTSYNSIVTVHGEVLHNERYDNLLGERDLLLADVGAETAEGWAGDVTRCWPVSGRFSPTQLALYQVVLAAELAAIAAVRPGVRYRDVHRVAGRQIAEGLVSLGILRGDPEQLLEAGAAALFFPHGVGHLLGLDVHDMEDLGDAAGYAPGRSRSTSRADRYLRLDRDLEPGMVVTIEPGFYRIPRLLDDPAEVGPLESMLDRRALDRYADVRGIRIEDDVLVTADGCEVLTRDAPKAPDDVERAVRG